MDMELKKVVDLILEKCDISRDEISEDKIDLIRKNGKMRDPGVYHLDIDKYFEDGSRLIADIGIENKFVLLYRDVCVNDKFIDELAEELASEVLEDIEEACYILDQQAVMDVGGFYDKRLANKIIKLAEKKVALRLK